MDIPDKMNHFGLFEGIGGFSLAARWMGWNTVGWCEINPFCQTVLKHHFPNAIGYGDIKTTDFRPWRGKIDILTGGFPCQDASRAKTNGDGQKGLQGERTGLYWHMLRAIEEIQPPFVVAENVPEILTTNGGDDFYKILKSLWEIGYDAEWKCLYAADEGAPHLRERCYMVIYANSHGLQKGESFFSNVCEAVHPEYRNIGGAIAPTRPPWDDEPPVPALVDGVSHKLDGSRYWYDQTIQAAGNAIVPQIAYRIFQAIQNAHLVSKTI